MGMGRAAVGPAGALSSALAEYVIDQIGDRGWSARELSRRSGLAPTRLNDCLNARQPFNLNEVAAIADVLGIRPALLIRRADESRRAPVVSIRRQADNEPITTAEIVSAAAHDPGHSPDDEPEVQEP